MGTITLLTNMPSWMEEFLGGQDILSGGSEIWNMLLKLAASSFSISPDELEGFGVVTGDLYDGFLGAGVILVTFFFFVSYIREISDFRHMLTLERTITVMVRVIITYALLLYLKPLLISIMGLFTDLTEISLSASASEIAGLSVNTGTAVSPLPGSPQLPGGGIAAAPRVNLFKIFLSIFYLLCAMVCGGIIVIEVWSRYLRIYVLIIGAPLAVSSFAGGQEAERTGHAFIRAFTGACAQVLIIGLTLTLAVAVSASMQEHFVSDASFWEKLFGVADAYKYVTQMLSMILTATAVKGADALLRHAFAL